MEYNELMKSLGDNLGLPDLTPDADGVYSLSIDGTIVSFIEVPDSWDLDIVAKLCELPSDGGEQIYKILLTAMAPGGSAENYNFFISPDDKCVYLRRTEVIPRLDTESLRKALEDFANALDEWRGSISDFLKAFPVIDEALKQQNNENRMFSPSNDGFMQV